MGVQDAEKVSLYEKQGVAIGEFELKSDYDTADHLFWLKDDSLEASDNLPEPDVIHGRSCNCRLLISDCGFEFINKRS